MLFLSGGTLYDGSGSLPRSGGLLIRDGRIASVGLAEAPAGAETLAIDGLAVAPGFIDLHSHSDLHSLEGDTTKLQQGVTTELVGNCGFSSFPNAGRPEAVGAYNEGILSSARSFFSVTEFLRAARAPEASTHLESLVGHGTLRTAVAALYPGAGGDKRIDLQASLLDDALAEGAAGFSSGLMYAPGATAPREELQALCAVTAKRGKLYATHMRSYSWQLLESIEEQIGLARDTGCRLQISHLQAVGKANWNKQPLALERIQSASDQGIDIGFDAYPYRAGCTVLDQLLPQQALESGFARFALDCANADYREKVERAVREQTAQAWSDIQIAFHGPLTSGRDVTGQTIAQIAAAWNQAPEAVVIDILLQSGGKANILAFNQSDENLHAAICHPLTSVISDGIHLNDRSHPRLYGTFPHLLGSLCQDQRWMSLTEGIHKITALPASRLQLGDRGRLAEGYRADIVLFDPQTIGTESSYDRPRQAPKGIYRVFREGRVVYPGVQRSG